MKVRNKTCKICKTRFKPYTTIQTVCSPKCALEYAKRKKEKKEAAASLMQKGLEDRVKEIKLGKDLENTRIYVHAFIHLRDKGKKCITCPRIDDGNFDAGHFYKAELYSTLKYDLDNIHLQCKYCNQYLEGNLNEYAIMLPQRIGKAPVERLKQLSQSYNRSTFKWDREQLKQIRSNVKELRKELLKAAK